MSDYQLLLARVARLYEKYGAGRRKPFNVFSVLRSETDEVNLHSRFLHALLDHRKWPEAERENLKDFLEHIAETPFTFEEEGAEVERERDNIDILISNADSTQAIVIENKIYAGDQPQQLTRYNKALERQGYSDRQLLFLTPHGRKPSKDSVGDLAYKTITYKDNLLPWLERCQKRAYDEPELRESVVQYQQLVHKLTGTDRMEEYMSELKELLLRDDNLVLACNVREAVSEVCIYLQQELWHDIESKLKDEIPDLPGKSEPSAITDEKIKNFITGTKNIGHGLYYPLGSGKVAKLGVVFEQMIYFGVQCFKKDHEQEYKKLHEALSPIGGGRKTEWWPWLKDVNKYKDLNLRYSTRKSLELLSNDEDRSKYAQEIASGLAEVWNTVKANGLAL